MRKFARRLVRLEARATGLAAETFREPHIIRFVDVGHRVVSELHLGTGTWTHFEDEPADRASQQALAIATDISS
jgi:hypothetical protein